MRYFLLDHNWAAHECEPGDPRSTPAILRRENVSIEWSVEVWFLARVPEGDNCFSLQVVYDGEGDIPVVSFPTGELARYDTYYEASGRLDGVYATMRAALRPRSRSRKRVPRPPLTVHRGRRQLLD